MGNNIVEKINEYLEYDDVFVAGGRPELIEKAETFLDVKLPESFKVYLSRWGNISIGAIEFYGLTKNDNFVDACIPNFAWFTARKRETINLPKHLIVFQSINDVEYLCLDVSTLTNGECPIVVWDNIEKEITDSFQITFLDFLLEELKENL